ncbi:MAG: class I SAM-dependent methyltransferase [Candidatus Omnitrophota bacterium]
MRKIIMFIIKYIYALACCLYMFTVAPLSTKSRFFISKICEYFGYHEKLKDPIIPIVKLAELVTDNSYVKILEPVGIDGHISLLEMTVIIKLIQRYKPKRLFEIGTFDGRTTLNMAANCIAEAEIYTLDLAKRKTGFTKLPICFNDELYINKKILSKKYTGTEYEKRINDLYGDSVEFNFSPFYNTIDFMFLDGSHSYEYVLNDSKQAIKLLKSGHGIILWHDYNVWRGVTEALKKIFQEDRRFSNLKYVEGTTLAYLNTG